MKNITNNALNGIAFELRQGLAALERAKRLAQKHGLNKEAKAIDKAEDNLITTYNRMVKRYKEENKQEAMEKEWKKEEEY